MDKNELKWSPSLGELIDRLSVVTLKELLIPGQRERYSKEIEDIIHDLDIFLAENPAQVTGNLIRHLFLLMTMNDRIWVNETNFRNRVKDGNNLELTHGLNSIRCLARAKAQACLDPDAPREFKADSVMPPENWIPSGY